MSTTSRTPAPLARLPGRGWKDAGRTVLTRFPLRLHDRRFWITQALVLAIGSTHAVLEMFHDRPVPDLELLPVSTYFVPVVYAALNFGVEGAVPTALWCATLTVPNLILWHTASQRPAIVLQLGLLIALAYVIARRVDVETQAKEEAEAAHERLRRAQTALEEYVRLATDAQEEERKRLARELHDDTIQSLVVAKGAIDAAANELGSREPARGRLRHVGDALNTTIDSIRRFSRDLRPSLLDDLGLVDAVDWLVADISARTGIAAELRVTGAPQRLASSVEIAMFRILQEALHNVEHHSGARRARVRMHFGTRFAASVVDDGVGFGHTLAADGDPSRRLGLLGMRERAKLAGARLSVTSRPQLGTRVVVRVEPD